MKNTPGQTGAKIVPTTRPVCLVIIDDDPYNVAFLSAALAQYQVDIFLSTDPRHGLELVRLHRPQIVLTDLIMPHFTGIDVLRRVKELDPATSVLIMTAAPCSATLALAVEYGATEYLAKPIPLSVVRQAIGDLIDGTARKLRCDGPERQNEGRNIGTTQANS
jgi:DNA-binding NtrC family response regulator